MITLYLVRHGDYANPRNIIPGRLPVELSEKGIVQIQKLRRFFKDQQITKIYASPVLRCKQTSEIISNNKIPIEYDQRLLEVLSSFQGYWEIDWQKFFNMRTELGGETNAEVQARVLQFFKEVDFEDNHNYIICSHGDPLFFLLLHLSNQPLVPDIVHAHDPRPYPDYLQKGEARAVILDAQKNVIEIQPIMTQDSL